MRWESAPFYESVLSIIECIITKLGLKLRVSVDKNAVVFKLTTKLSRISPKSVDQIIR